MSRTDFEYEMKDQKQEWVKPAAVEGNKMRLCNHKLSYISPNLQLKLHNESIAAQLTQAYATLIANNFKNPEDEAKESVVIKQAFIYFQDLLDRGEL